MKGYLKSVLLLSVLAMLALVLTACGYKVATKATTSTPTSSPTSSTASINTSDAATKPDGGASSSTTKSQNSGNATAKKSISSPSLLTNEMTGKGVVSLGDSVARVKQTLANYQPTFGPSTITGDTSNQNGESFFFGDTTYIFNPAGKLEGFYSAGGGGPFETSKGLKIGDPLSKVFALYGKNYTFNDGGTDNQPSYSFAFGDTALGIIVKTSSKQKGDMDATVYQIGCGLKQ